ncbi:MAG: sensor histidine kinase [Solirubrobacteraceae bacterium]
MLYGLLFLIAGTALLAITYGLVARDSTTQTDGKFVVSRGVTGGKLPSLPAGVKAVITQRISPGAIVQQKNPLGPVVGLQAYAGQVNATFRRLSAAQATELKKVQARANAGIDQVKHAQLSTLLTRSGLALAIMALASIGLGWVMAGRALRPVRTMSSRARGISERNLHERLALDGPDDELKELATTFDGLLGRLEAAFESQRRFVANASHELRTPITLERALVEVALADPHPTIESLQDTCQRVLAASEQQERLIESLLTLARSQRGLESRVPVDLREITAEVVRAVPADGLRIETDLRVARTTGDQAMVERLVANLVENAVHYNQPDGWISAWTGQRDGLPTVEVVNAGPLVQRGEVDELMKPFYRGGVNGNTNANGYGLGLGLSIVQAIAEAHGAALRTEARAEGGLRVTVAFPATGPESGD